MSSPLCQVLSWDSNFFRCKIARVIVKQLTSDQHRALERWCQRVGVNCVFLLVDAADSRSLRLAEDHQFALMDIRTTLEILLEESQAKRRDVPHHKIRLAAPEDIPELRRIAGTSHGDSRFYADPNFPRHMCDEFYRTWIENSCRGSAGAILVAELRGLAVGYLTCELQGGRQGRFGLMGVDSTSTRAGIGADLVHCGLTWFVERGVTLVTVVTQGRNIKSQRLFQRAGFLTRSVELWFHRWFVPPGGATWSHAYRATQALGPLE